MSDISFSLKRRWIYTRSSISVILLIVNCCSCVVLPRIPVPFEPIFNALKKNIFSSKQFDNSFVFSKSIKLETFWFAGVPGCVSGWKTLGLAVPTFSNIRLSARREMAIKTVITDMNQARSAYLHTACTCSFITGLSILNLHLIFPAEPHFRQVVGHAQDSLRWSKEGVVPVTSLSTTNSTLRSFSLAHVWRHRRICWDASVVLDPWRNSRADGRCFIKQGLHNNGH